MLSCHGSLYCTFDPTYKFVHSFTWNRSLGVFLLRSFACDWELSFRSFVLVVSFGSFRFPINVNCNGGFHGTVTVSPVSESLSKSNFGSSAMKESSNSSESPGLTATRLGNGCGVAGWSRSGNSSVSASDDKNETDFFIETAFDFDQAGAMPRLCFLLQTR